MESLRTQLDQLENTQLLRRLPDEELTYLFKHALTQEASYESLLLKRRREIHRRVAETIERLYADRLDEQADILAQHYAESGDDAKTLEFSLLAADHAARLFAYVEARWHYSHALDALARLPNNEENRRRRVDTLVKQVAVSLRSDGPDRNLERLNEAESLLRSLSPVEGDRERLAYIQYWTGHAYVHRNQPAEGIAYLRQVLAAAQEGVGGPELLAIPAGVIGRSLTLQGKFSEAEPMLAQALGPLERTANWHEWILASGMHAMCLAEQGQLPPAFAETERALRQAEATGTLVGIAQCHMMLAIVSMESEEYERMRTEGNAAAQTGEKGGDRLLIYAGLGLASWGEALLGNLDTAGELSRRAVSVGETIGPRLVFSDMFAAGRAEMALLGGRLDDATVRAREALDLAHEVGSRFSEGLAERVWGRALAELPSPNWAEAEAHMAASLQAFEASHAWLEAARTHVAWGRVLQARGQAEAARENYEKAAAQFQASGLTGALERTRRSISSLSAR
jgi:tetratricopeptide (TPR) repeat protein